MRTAVEPPLSETAAAKKYTVFEATADRTAPVDDSTYT
jgi:hypothetical protein